EYREAIRLDPKSALAHNNLAWMLATGSDGVRNGKRAVQHATRACELTAWKNSVFLDTLAAAYAEAGDFARAVEYQTKAADLAVGDKKQEADLRRRIGLYERKQPYRDPAFARREVAPPPRPVKRSSP